MEVKTYNLKTLEQMINVLNKDNVDLFCKDFELWIKFVIEQIERIKLTNPEKYQNNYDIGKYEFIWSDDGINDLTTFKVTNNESGEVKIYDISTKEHDPIKSYCSKDNMDGLRCETQCDECKLKQDDWHL